MMRETSKLSPPLNTIVPLAMVVYDHLMPSESLSASTQLLLMDFPDTQHNPQYSNVQTL